MRYRHHDSMLPSGAFQRRGTVTGGSLRLHGGGDGGYYYDQAAADEAAYQAAMAAWNPPAPGPAPSYDPGPAPSYDPGPAPAPAPAPYNPPAPEPAPYNPPPAPAPAGPDWTQTVNDIYQQTFGRQADASGLATFTNLLNSGWTGEQVRGALYSSQEYQQQQAAQAPAPAPTPAPAPAGPNWTQTVNDIYQQTLGRQADASGMATFTNLLNQGWTGEQIRNTLTSSQEYQQAHPSAPTTPTNPVAPGQIPAPQYHVETRYDQNDNPSYLLVDQNGQGVQYLTPTRDDNGNITGYGITTGGGGDQSATVAPININQLNQQAAQVAAAPPAYGAGEGRATGQPYAIVRTDGLPYREYDAQGNLTRFRDSEWQWHNAADVKASGTQILSDGRVQATYDLGGAVPMNRNLTSGGGVLQQIDWKMAASVVAMAVMAFAGPAIMSALVGEAAGGVAGAEALAQGLGMTVNEAVESGLIGVQGGLTDAGAQFVMNGAGIAPEVAASVLDGTIPTETLATATNQVTDAYNTIQPGLSSSNPNDVFNTLVDQMTRNGNLPTTPVPGSATAAAAGAVSDVGAGITVPGAASAAPSATTSFLTQAAKAAAINAGMTALQGGSPTDILRAAAGGIVGAGIGIGLADVMGNSLLSQVAGRAAASAGAAVVAGGNPMKAALQGATFAAVAGMLPGALDKLDSYKDLSASTKEYIINSLSNGISQAAAGTGTLTQGMLTGAIGTYVDKMGSDLLKGINQDPNSFVDDIKNTVKKFWTAEGSNIIQSGPMAGYEIGVPIPGSETAQAGTSDQTTTIPGRVGEGAGVAPHDYDKLLQEYQKTDPGATMYSDNFATWLRNTDPNVLWDIQQNPFQYNMPEGMREATPGEIASGQAQPAIVMSTGGFAQKNTYLMPVTPGPTTPPGPVTPPSTTPGTTPVTTPGTTPVTPVTPGTTPTTPPATTPGTTPTTPPVTPPVAPVAAPVKVSNGNGTSTTTRPDGSTVTTDDATDSVIISTPPRTTTPGTPAPGTGLIPGAGTGPGTGGTGPGGGGPGGTGGGGPGGTGGGGTGQTPGGGGTGTGGGGGGTWPNNPFPIITIPPARPVTRPDPGTFTPGAPYPLAPLAEGGMNPGYLMGGAVQPYYQTTNPTQPEYYWGGHPYIPTLEQIGLWNQPVGAPSVPFGATSGPQTAFNTNINTLLPVIPQ